MPFFIVEMVYILSHGGDQLAAPTFIALRMICGFLGILVLMFTSFFGPQLVVFHRFKPFDAFRTSFFASLKNWRAGLLFCLLSFLVSVAGFVCCCVGTLVSAPLCLMASYSAYRNVFFTGQDDN